MASQKNKRILFISLLFFLLILIAVFAFTFYTRWKKQSALGSSYNSVLVSMYPIDGFSEASFLTYRGLNTEVEYQTMTDLQSLTRYAENVLDAGNAVSTIYIGLDPYLFYTKNVQSDADMATEMASLLNCIASHPDVTFEFLLPALPMEEWAMQDEEEIIDILTAYYFAVSCLEPHSNVLCFFVGGEEWLIRNHTNYTDTRSLNPMIADKILCSTFCDRLFQINPSNAKTVLGSLYEMIMAEKASPAFYPNWSDRTIVFFGDSILGLQNGSYSIPGVINGLTGATVYNYAIGGTCACDTDPTGNDCSFKDRLDLFLSQANFETNDNTVFPYNEHAADENLIFVISYGYNDYKNQQSTENFGPSLKDGITRLQSAYPDAQILIMAPYECIWSAGGSATENEIGETLAMYGDAVKEIAADQNIVCMDIPSLLANDVNETNFTEYFNDECHYSEYGRFYMAEQIIYALDEAGSLH